MHRYRDIYSAVTANTEHEWARVGGANVIRRYFNELTAKRLPLYNQYVGNDAAKKNPSKDDSFHNSTIYDSVKV